MRQQVESLNRDLNDANERTRATQKEKEEKEAEIADLNRRMEAALEASRVIQERQTIVSQEKAARAQAEQRSIALLTEKKTWEESLSSRDAKIAELETRVGELTEKEADLTLELKVGVDES